jgi:hypothetical protein
MAGVDEVMARGRKSVARDVGRRTRVPPARCRSDIGMEDCK